MEVILREDVPSLGKAGDVVKVSPGLGRNFLFPRKKAVEATQGNLKQLESQKQAIEARRAKTRQQAEEFGKKISALTITIEKQAGEEDKIFGNVSTKEISQELAKQGVEIDKRLIRSKTPIKKVGEHVVEIHLHGDVVVPLKIVVQKK